MISTICHKSANCETMLCFGKLSCVCSVYVVKYSRCCVYTSRWCQLPLNKFENSLLSKYRYLWSGKFVQWRHNKHDGVANHQPHDCLLNRLFRRRSKKTSKHRITGLCAGNLPVTGEFPAQMASNAENVSIWWRHHDGYWHLPLGSSHLVNFLMLEAVGDRGRLKPQIHGSPFLHAVLLPQPGFPV